MVELLFGGVSIIALGDLFQLEPVMDGYVFQDIKNSEYVALRYTSELFSFYQACHEFLKRCCPNMLQLSKYGSTWPNKWL